MKFAFTIIALAYFALAASCPATTAGQTVSPGQESELAPGQTVTIAGTGLSLRFVEIVADSRCPTGVQCIWAGEASALVEISYQDSVNQRVLTVPGSSTGQAAFNDFTFIYQIEPYPQYPKTINRQDYRLRITVTKP